MQKHDASSSRPSIPPRSIFVLKRIANAALFYLGWLVCIQQAPGKHPYAGPLLVAGIIGYHLMSTHLKLIDFILMTTLAAVGTIVDTLYVQTGFIDYSGGYGALPGVAPLWITSLWALYAVSVNHSLSWLGVHSLLAALMGALGGVSSYLAGVKLGAAVFYYPEVVWMTVIGGVWGFVVPASLKYSHWLRTKLG